MSGSGQSSPHDIEIGEVRKVIPEWLRKKLKVDDKLAEQGMALLTKIYGKIDGPTIFQRKHEANGRKLPKPRAVAIGPYHRDSRNRLTFDDDYKWKITRFLVNYWSLDVGKYAEEMEEEEVFLRSCYDKELDDWSSEDFRTMLLLDSSFIVFATDAFCDSALGSFFMEYTALYLGVREHSTNIKLDLLTVDNQIPFSAVELLKSCFCKDHGIQESIEHSVLACFDDLSPIRNEEKVLEKKRKDGRVKSREEPLFRRLLCLCDLRPIRNEKKVSRNKRNEDLETGRHTTRFLRLLHLSMIVERIFKTKRNETGRVTSRFTPQFHHLLHLFHWSRIPKEGYEMASKTQVEKKSASQQYIPSATELQKSYTQFKKNESGSCLDITFKRRLTRVSGVINIPVLHLYSYSESIFRNLIAFEANPTNNVLCFTAYTACMSCILQREDDVKVLREGGIVASTNFKDADVVSFFMELNREIEDSLMPSTLLELYDGVTNHHKNGCSNWWGHLKLQYCPNVWIGLSLVGAFMLFIFSHLFRPYIACSLITSLRGHLVRNR